MKTKSIIQMTVLIAGMAGLSLFFQNCNSALNAQKGLVSSNGLLGNLSSSSLGRTFLKVVFVLF